MATEGALLRIGELSRRTGVSVELLRAWENRYRLLRPRRTAGGFRLYSEVDATRIDRMRALLATGLSAAQAARTVLQEERASGRAASVPDGLLPQLDRLLLAFDERGAHAALDRLFSGTMLETAVADAILPELRSIGDRWAAGTITVAQEHFASNLIRARLLGLARGWDEGRGRRVVLACVPHELHDIGLICFGLVLRRKGWRIVYLGQDTPIPSAESALERSGARVFVATSTLPRHFGAIEEELAALSRRVRVAIGGSGATAEHARRSKATLLGPDLMAGAEQLAQAVR